MKNTIPRGGYIPGPALSKIATKILKRERVQQTDKAEAERYARGPEYPRGPWDDRPPYRMAVLKYRHRRARLHQILLGRRKAPSALSITKAVVHHVLVTEAMHLGPRYGVFCAGATFFGRRGMCVPKGRKDDIPLGDTGYSKWTLSFNDLAMLGGHAIRAAAKMGLKLKDRDLREFILKEYLLGVEEGVYDPPVSVPHLSMATKMLGDSVFAHKLSHKSPEVPPQYRGKIRQANGHIAGEWPVGIEPAKPKPEPPKPEPKKPMAMPSTDWLFNR